MKAIWRSYMADNNDNLLIRVPKSLKLLIEKTAKLENKKVSEFVRDVLILYMSKNESDTEYISCLKQLSELKDKERQLKELLYDEDSKLNNCQDGNEDVLNANYFYKLLKK
jgi:hypothetical protein